MAKNRLFSNDKPYEGRYKKERTEAQKQAAIKNLQDWNRLRSNYGLEKAKEIATRRRNLKKTFNEEGTGNVPLKNRPAQDRFAAIMDSLPPEERERIRETNDSEDVLEAGSRWLEEKEFEEDEYMDADVAQELIDSWLRWSAQ